MRKVSLQILLLALGMFALNGCVDSHRAWVREPATPAYPGGEIVVTEAPPPPRIEIPGTPPDEIHVWVAGYWTHADQSWVWIPGHWEARPRPAAVWVPGQWNKKTDGPGWTWTPGHWE